MLSLGRLAAAATCLVAGILAAPAAFAQSSTQNYTYDARGRLVAVDVSGGSADGTTRDYTYDRAGNRTNVTTAGSLALGDAPDFDQQNMSRTRFAGTYSFDFKIDLAINDPSVQVQDGEAMNADYEDNG